MEAGNPAAVAAGSSPARVARENRFAWWMGDRRIPACTTIRARRNFCRERFVETTRLRARPESVYLESNPARLIARSSRPAVRNPWPPTSAPRAPMHRLPVREVARLIVVDSGGSILLVRYRDHRVSARSYWATPGGGVEPGESLEEAAARELREETGLQQAIGPLLWRRRFQWESPQGCVEQAETFFLVRIDETAPVVRNSSPEAIEDHRWWSVADLERTAETVYPEELKTQLARWLGLQVPAPIVDPA